MYESENESPKFWGTNERIDSEPKKRETCQRWQEAMTMTMTHSEKSHIRRMKAWPYKQECRGHDLTKKNLFYWWNLLIGKVCKYNCHGQSVVQRDMRWTQCTCKRKPKQGPQAVAVLNSQINHRIVGFGATPQTQQKESKKPRSQEAKTGKPGEAKAPRERTAWYLSTAVVPDIGPNFCSLVRTKFVREFFHLVENPSRTSWSLFVHHHNALDHCAAAALFKVLVFSFLFLSF